MKWKVLETEYLFKNPPWLTTRIDKCELPNGKVMNAYYVHEYPNWVSAVAITKNQEIVMVRQYRHGLGEVLLELPGGVVDPGEAPEKAIIRELKEETGYEFKTFEYLGKISANPATTNNYMHMYLATGGEKTGEQMLDETEDVETVVLPISELKQLIRENRIVQALHLSCIFYGLEKLGEIRF